MFYCTYTKLSDTSLFQKDDEMGNATNLPTAGGLGLAKGKARIIRPDTAAATNHAESAKFLFPRPHHAMKAPSRNSAPDALMRTQSGNI